MNNNSCVCMAIAVVVLAVLGVSTYLLVTLDGNNGIIVCKVLIVMLMLICSILVCCVISCHNKMSNISEEQLVGWIKKAIAENIQVKSDETIISKLEAVEYKFADRIKRVNDEQTHKMESIMKAHADALSKQLTDFDKSLHDDLEKVFFTKNSNLKFLQEMAHSIGKDGSAWKDDQIKKFMTTLVSIEDTLTKEINS